ncbi:MAG: hypothetical protein JWQ22_594 [Devosia sp.]|nr:hypothetical protein [Devosia sp.]
MQEKTDRRAGYLIVGGFVLALVIVVLWLVLEFSGVMPGDSAVLPPEEPATVLPAK